MNFWASAEMDILAIGLDPTRRIFVPILNDELTKSSLANLHWKLRYIPIVMRPEWVSRYPERSKVRWKECVIVIAPQLDFKIFTTENIDLQVREYADGLLRNLHILKRAKIPEDLLQEFIAVVERTVDYVKSQKLVGLPLTRLLQ